MSPFSWLAALLLVVSLFQVGRWGPLSPCQLSAMPQPCSDDLASLGFLRSRGDYALVIGIFTGEYGKGYEGYENRGYRERRDAIRTSWLKEAVAAGVPTFFILSNWNLTEAHRREATQARDVLLLDDPDGLAWGYRGLVHKTLFTLQFMARQCASFTYFLKTDDDTFIHVPNMLAMVHSSPPTLAMMGYLQPHGNVLLDGGVWDNHEFLEDTGLNAYPSYFLGGGYLMTSDIVHALGTLTRTIPMQRWPVEDTTLSVWLVGWNLTRISINHRYLDFHYINPARWTRKFCRDDWLVVHHINIDVWQRLVAKCRHAHGSTAASALATGFEETP